MSAAAYTITLLGASGAPPHRVAGTERGLLTAKAAAEGWLRACPEYRLAAITGKATGNLALNVWREENRK